MTCGVLLRDDSSSTHNVVHAVYIQQRCFFLIDPEFEALDNGSAYCLYDLPHTRYIVSVTHLSVLHASPVEFVSGVASLTVASASLTFTSVSLGVSSSVSSFGLSTKAFLTAARMSLGRTGFVKN